MKRLRTKFSLDTVSKDKRAALPPYVIQPHLHPQDALFIFELLADMNPAQAAIRAGLAPDNKLSTATQEAEKRLNNPEVKKAFEQALHDRAVKTLTTIDKVVHEYSKIAFLDPADLFNEDGSVKSIHSMDKETRAAIQEIKHVTKVTKTSKDKTVSRYITSIKLHSKTDALKTLLQFTGGISNDVNVSITGNTFNNQINIQEAGLTDQELQVLTRLIGEDTEDVIELERIQDQCFSQRLQ